MGGGRVRSDEGGGGDGGSELVRPMASVHKAIRRHLNPHQAKQARRRQSCESRPVSPIGAHVSPATGGPVSLAGAETGRELAPDMARAENARPAQCRIAAFRAFRLSQASKGGLAWAFRLSQALMSGRTRAFGLTQASQPGVTQALGLTQASIAGPAQAFGLTQALRPGSASGGSRSWLRPRSELLGDRRRLGGAVHPSSGPSSPLEAAGAASRMCCNPGPIMIRATQTRSPAHDPEACARAQSLRSP